MEGEAQGYNPRTGHFCSSLLIIFANQGKSLVKCEAIMAESSKYQNDKDKSYAWHMM